MDERIYIGKAAVLLDRREATIRGWERDGLLPEKLQAYRDDKGWRFWKLEQIEGIKAWIIANDRRPGKGLPHYKPTPSKIAAHIVKTRGPRVA